MVEDLGALTSVPPWQSLAQAYIEGVVVEVEVGCWQLPLHCSLLMVLHTVVEELGAAVVVVVALLPLGVSVCSD